MEAFAGWSVRSARAHEKPCVRTKPGGGRSRQRGQPPPPRAAGLRGKNTWGHKAAAVPAAGRPRAARGERRERASSQAPHSAPLCPSAAGAGSRLAGPGTPAGHRVYSAVDAEGAEGVRNLGSGSPDRPSPAAAPEEAGPIPTRGADQRALHGPGGDRPGHVLAEGGPGVVGWRSVTQG